MDKSKMAIPGTKINYDPNKGANAHDGMSRSVKQACTSEFCYCDDCRDEKGDRTGSKSLDETLDPTDEDCCGPCCY